jgi:hypothetical protein
MAMIIFTIEADLPSTLLVFCWSDELRSYSAALNDPRFQAVQPAEILHLFSIVSVKKQLVKSGEA